METLTQSLQLTETIQEIVAEREQLIIDTAERDKENEREALEKEVKRKRD